MRESLIRTSTFLRLSFDFPSTFLRLSFDFPSTTLRTGYSGQATQDRLLRVTDFFGTYLGAFSFFHYGLRNEPRLALLLESGIKNQEPRAKTYCVDY